MTAFKHKLIKHLDEHNVKYGFLDHKLVYTAYDLAQTLREKLEHIAKTLVVKAGNNHVLVVLPGSHRLDVTKLKTCLGVKSVSIVDEQAIAKVFNIKAGAITAFGKLHDNTPVYVDKALTKAKKVVAATGNFEQSVHMGVKDFLKATQAKIAAFSEKSKLKLQARPEPRRRAKVKKAKKAPKKGTLRPVQGKTKRPMKKGAAKKK